MMYYFCGCVFSSAVLYSHAVLYLKTLNVTHCWTFVKLPLLQVFTVTSIVMICFFFPLLFLFFTFCVVTSAYFLQHDRGIYLCSITKLVRWLYLNLEHQKYKDHSAIFVNVQVGVKTRHKSCQGMMWKQGSRI